MAHKTERHIRADRTGNMVQFILCEWHIPQPIHASQNRGCVCASSPEPGGNRYLLSDPYRYHASFSGGFKKSHSRAIRNILRTSRRHLREDINSYLIFRHYTSFKPLNPNLVCKLYTVHHRFDIMVTVRSEPDNIESKIDFCPGFAFNHTHETTSIR
jgi:hypothetical protein